MLIFNYLFALNTPKPRPVLRAIDSREFIAGRDWYESDQELDTYLDEHDHDAPDFAEGYYSAARDDGSFAE